MALRFPRRRIGVLFMSLAFASMGKAASFNCSKAHAPVERAVCADRQLSDADTLLAQRYSKAMSQLSDAGQRIVQDGQRQWLRYVRDLCTGRAKAKASAVASCLKDAYDDRLKDLTLAAVRIGPYLFSRIDFYEAANPDEEGVLSKGKIATPRIDSPLTPVAMEWNKVMARLHASRSHSAGCDGPSGDYADDYTIEGVTRTTISVVMSDSMYCHGTPHGYGGSKSIVYVTEPALHLLAASDLFRSDTNWTEFLVQRSVLKIREDSAAPGLDLPAIANVVRQPQSWALANEGLVITIGMLEVGAGPGVAKVAVSWSELQPFLTAAASAMH